MEDGPPDLDDVPMTKISKPVKAARPASSVPVAAASAPPEGMTLMDQMMADYDMARNQKQRERREEEGKMASTFGTGLKGGFFGGDSGQENQPPKKTEEAVKVCFNSICGLVKTPGMSFAKCGRCKVAVYCSQKCQREDWKSHKLQCNQLASSKKKPSTSSSTATKAATPDIPTLRATSAKSNDSKTGGGGMVLPEVQAAMSESTNPLAQQLQKGEWVTPELTKAMAANPKLLAGLQNPRFMAALGEMQRDPKAAQAKYQHDSELRQFLSEFGAIMGEHFSKLGASADSTAAGGAQQQQQQQVAPQITPSAAAAGAQDDPAVQRVLADPSLRDLLMDPEMQRILQQCGDPRQLRRHMAHPPTAVKLRKLMDAGLVQMQA